MVLNTGSKYGAIAVSFLTYFLLTPFLKSTLGPRLLGLRTLAVQALQFVGLAADALGVSYNRYATAEYARSDYERMNAYLSGGLLLSLVSGAVYLLGTVAATVFAGSLFGLSSDLLPLGRFVILVSGLATAFHILIGVWKAPTFITQRFYIDSIGRIIAVAGGAAAVVVAFKAGSPSMALYVVLVCGARVLSEILYVVPHCRRALPEMAVRLRSGLASKELRQMMNFGFLSLMTGLGHHLYYSSDSIIISNLDQLSIDNVFYYSIAQRWDPQIRLVVMAFVVVLTPMMTSLAAVKDRARLQGVLLRAVRYASIIGILPCVLLFVYASPFLEHWLDAEAALRSASVLRVVMVALAFGIPSRVAAETLYAIGRIGVAAWVTVAGGVLNIALSILFVVVFDMGLLGVALGSLTALAVKDWIALPWLAVSYTGVRPLSFIANGWIRPLTAGVAALTAGGALRFAWEPGGIAIVFVHFVLVAGVYAIAAYGLALNRDDRAKVMGFVQALVRR